MAPSEFGLRLQRGITGGFAPPTPDKIVTLQAGPGAGDDKLIVSVASRPPGTPELQQTSPKTVAIADHQAVIDELYGILQGLPTEHPPGSEDIYGLDTSIAWMSEDLEWCNGGPQGCGGGESDVKPTEENKVQFKRAIEIIEEISGAK